MSEIGSEVPEITKQSSKQAEKKLLSRRSFLQLTGGAGAAAILASVSRHLELGRSEKPNEFTISHDQDVLNVVEDVGFQEDAVRKMMREASISEEQYGILAASGVSYIDILREENKDLFVGAGSAGLVEHGGGYFISTAMHVIDMWLEDPKWKMHISIPGIEEVYQVLPHEIYTFNPYPEIEFDEPVFIKISDKSLVNQIDTLRKQNRLQPLVPRTYYEPRDTELSLFRYQGENPEVALFTVTEDVSSQNVKRYKGDTTSGKPLVCVGVSGTPVIRRDGKKLTNEFLGVVTNGSSKDPLPDPLGELSPTCGSDFWFGTYFDEWYRMGKLNARRTHAG